MSENNTADWTIGVKYVQFSKTSSFNVGIKQSPYATLLGIEAGIGLTSSSLPHDVIQKVQTEDDLLAILASSSTQPYTQPLPETTQPLSDMIQPLPETTQPLSEITSTRNDSTNEQHRQEKKACNSAQQKQAERVVKRTRVIMKDDAVCDNVTVPIPSVDRGRGDARHILDVIVVVEN